MSQFPRKGLDITSIPDDKLNTEQRDFLRNLRAINVPDNIAVVALPQDVDDNPFNTNPFTNQSISLNGNPFHVLPLHQITNKSIKSSSSKSQSRILVKPDTGMHKASSHIIINNSADQVLVSLTAWGSYGSQSWYPLPSKTFTAYMRQRVPQCVVIASKGNMENCIGSMVFPDASLIVFNTFAELLVINDNKDIGAITSVRAMPTEVLTPLIAPLQFLSASDSLNKPIWTNGDELFGKINPTINDQFDFFRSQYNIQKSPEAGIHGTTIDWHYDLNHASQLPHTSSIHDDEKWAYVHSLLLQNGNAPNDSQMWIQPVNRSMTGNNGLEGELQMTPIWSGFLRSCSLSLESTNQHFTEQDLAQAKGLLGSLFGSIFKSIPASQSKSGMGDIISMLINNPVISSVFGTFADLSGDIPIVGAPLASLIQNLPGTLTGLLSGVRAAQRQSRMISSAVKTLRAQRSSVPPDNIRYNSPEIVAAFYKILKKFVPEAEGKWLCRLSHNPDRMALLVKQLYLAVETAHTDSTQSPCYAAEYSSNENEQVNIDSLNGASEQVNELLGELASALEEQQNTAVRGAKSGCY